MRRWLFLCLCAALCCEAAAQAPHACVVLLKDKDMALFSLSQPERFLSPYAVAKRQRFRIPVTEADIPVKQAYLDTLDALESSCQVLTSSKWFNYVVLGTTDSAGFSDSLMERIGRLGWVNEVCPLHRLPDSLLAAWFDIFSKVVAVGGSGEATFPEADPDTTDADSLWGASALQLACLNGLFLHRHGYAGKGMRIAVADGGFLNVDSLEMFGSFRNEGRLKGFQDVSGDTTPFFRVREAHGQKVLSIMAVNRPGEYVGSAPDADYWLFHSERTDYENLLEEFFFVAAVEKADSLGADVMNVSLGYTQFDDKVQNHTWYDLDGRHSVASIAAEAAVHRGCIVNVAAGNDGNKTWIMFGIPSDAPAVLCVAAVNTDSAVASFSSRGDSLWMKPDIASVGWNTAFCDVNDRVAHGNGTSFATPLNAGLTACLWQAFPHKTAEEVIQAVRQSANRYNDWNCLTGYGIPDYAKAFHLLKGDLPVAGAAEVFSFRCFPNPVTERLQLLFDAGRPLPAVVRLYDAGGRLLCRLPVTAHMMELDLSQYPAGGYFLLLSGHGADALRMVVKQ
ncbi:MAG: S8 family peptidase [Bacteroidales bacterium]|nr:S8 family peptidase [Bacteroidales bacterium]